MENNIVIKDLKNDTSHIMTATERIPTEDDFPKITEEERRILKEKLKDYHVE